MGKFTALNSSLIGHDRYVGLLENYVIVLYLHTYTLKFCSSNFVSEKIIIQELFI
mgnify:CR=1 FL=1